MPPKKKAANGYKFAEPLPKGTLLNDIGKNCWRLGPSIGKGGFGEIYSAQEENAKGAKYPYVVKIEPHSNGPLFVEINFYVRHAKLNEIESFKAERKLKTFGMPVYRGSGSHEYKGEKYRFLVLDKFATDIYKLYVDNHKIFPVDTVFKVAIQLLDVLEYIHLRGYVHADIKAANVLLDSPKESLYKQVYLVDFGLATKFTMEKDFKPNPKKAHDGTIEFLSRDAHQGVQTRRGDLEVLAYNLIQWLGCKLPWESNLSDPKVVHKSKEENMATVQKMIKASFGTKSHPKAIVDYLTYLKSLQFDTEPDYRKIRSIFTSGVKEGGGAIGTPLQFSSTKTPPKRTRTPLTSSRSKKAKPTEDQENELDGDETPKPKKRERAKKDVAVAEPDDNIMEVDKIDDIISNTYNEAIPVAKITGRPKRNIKTKVKNPPSTATSISEMSDVQMADVTESNSTVQKRQPRKPLKLATNDVEMIPASESEITAMETDEKPRRKGKTAATRNPATKRGRRKVQESISDSEIPTANGIDEVASNFVTKRVRNKPPSKKALNEKKTLNKRISQSLDNIANIDALEGFTDAMKEIMRKKMEKADRKKLTNQTKKTEPVGNHEDMTGYTEEMKAIALKKNGKPKNVKNTSNVPIATTSKLSKRGVTKPSSKRLKTNLPITHGDVVGYSDGSSSE